VKGVSVSDATAGVTTWLADAVTTGIGGGQGERRRRRGDADMSGRRDRGLQRRQGQGHGRWVATRGVLTVGARADRDMVAVDGVTVVLAVAVTVGAYMVSASAAVSGTTWRGLPTLGAWVVSARDPAPGVTVTGVRTLGAKVVSVRAMVSGVTSRGVRTDGAKAEVVRLAVPGVTTWFTVAVTVGAKVVSVQGGRIRRRDLVGRHRDRGGERARAERGDPRRDHLVDRWPWWRARRW